MKSELLRVEYLCKAFHQDMVLNHVTFSIFEGEALVVLGASGAGKTSLSQILGGLIQQDSGRIFFREKPVSFHSLRDAQSHGIHIVQHSGRVVDALSINENIFLANPKGFWIRRKKLINQSKKLADLVGLPYDPSTLAKDLTSSEKSLLELAAVINEHPNLLIFDEPPFPSTNRINKKMFSVIKKIKASNAAVLYITENIKEALEIGDRILVLKNGVATGLFERGNSNFDENRLLTIITGDKNLLPPGNPPASLLMPVFQVKDLTYRFLTNISFSLSKGEILGIISPMGSSKKTLLQLLYGYIKKSAGSLFIDGKQVEIKSPGDAIRNGIAYYTADRENSHLITSLTAMENITLMATRHISTMGWIKPYIEKHYAKTRLELMNIPELMMNVPVCNLNNGTQQKIQFAQCLIHKPKIMLLYEPLNGIDLVTKNEIAQAVRKLADEGMSIIVASSNIEKMLDLCDRFIVMNNGLIKGELSSIEANQSKMIGLMQN